MKSKENTSNFDKVFDLILDNQKTVYIITMVISLSVSAVLLHKTKIKIRDYNNSLPNTETILTTKNK